ncbi:hypothetical protein HY384_00775 [Candidatus Daviesbacteria bacterium]|nr:hypothetical protein [Candidatus Daviesbacteria bacterium]
MKTLIYADIFDYPLKIWEIHRWLIGKKASLRQLKKALEKLLQNGKCKLKNGYYFLPGREGLVLKRKNRQKQSERYLKKAKILTQILKPITWVKLVGISGGLAMGNVSKSHDIDLFIIAAKNKLWLCRLFILGLLSLVGQRRKIGQKGHDVAGKLCINTLLEGDKLEQDNKDIYLAHEVLQMKVLWQRDGIYAKYLSDNSWAFKFLPNWVGNQYQGSKDYSTFYIRHTTLFNVFENLAKKFQLWYMKSPKGMERIEDGALYFHPKDCRLEVLAKYQQGLKKLAGLDK